MQPNYISTLDLYYREFGQGKPVFILHGLFGFSDNWQTIAKALSEEHLVVTPDLRNHGRSPHVDTHSYPEMAEDLVQFMESHWMFSASFIGHSMGGKVAMQLALTYPDLVERLVVVDMAPGPSKSDHTGIFDALLGLDLRTMESRASAEAFLKARIPDTGTVQFLLKNITRSQDGSYAWKMNLPVLFQQYQEVLRPLSGTPFHKPTLFIRGGRSHYINNEDWPGILDLFPNAQLATIEEAGHWVHAEQPAALLELIQRFLATSD